MSGIEREVFFCERCEAIGEESACSCDDKGRWVTLVVTAAENLTRAERERDEARAEAARWKEQAEAMGRSYVVAKANEARWEAEAERLREDMKHALMVADETASMQCECDGYYRCGSCPTRIADRAEDVAEILKRSLDNDWGSALSAGGGTDA